jgi:hypothetical protein
MNGERQIAEHRVLHKEQKLVARKAGLMHGVFDTSIVVFDMTFTNSFVLNTKNIQRHKRSNFASSRTQTRKSAQKKRGKVHTPKFNKHKEFGIFQRPKNIRKSQVALSKSYVLRLRLSQLICHSTLFSDSLRTGSDIKKINLMVGDRTLKREDDSVKQSFL